MVHQSKTIVDATADAGLQFIVHLGIFGNGRTTDPHFAWHEMVERYIEGSGVAWSHIHPHFFMDNLLTSVLVVNGRFYWFTGDKRVGWIAADDLAAVSAQVLAEGPQKHARKQYWLSTEVMNGVEAAAEIAEGLGQVHNLIACQKSRIRPHLKLLGESNRGKGRGEGIYSEERFIYDPSTNTYRCPANQTMKPRRLHPQRLTWEYVTAKGTCLVCKLRVFCTRSHTGRTIHRHREQELLERARKIANSKAAKRDLKRRQHLIERSFADAANCHGLKRARWRGLCKQAIQDLLIAAVQNLRKLIKHLAQINPEWAWQLAQFLRRLIAPRLPDLMALLPI
jgi:hypothetical protein